MKTSLPNISRRGFLAASLLALTGCQLPDNSSSTNSNTMTVHNLTMHPDNWQKWQKIVALGMLVNVNYSYVAENEAALFTNASKLNNALVSGSVLANYLGEGWKIVWGPGLINDQKVTSGAGTGWVSVNAMFVAEGKDPLTGKKMYVLAVAATNQVSQTDWVVEDLNVVQTSVWTPVDNTTDKAGVISQGTRIGLTNLLGLRDPNSGVDVLTFLRGLSRDESVEIAVTGASLGGALSSVMALTLIETFARESLSHFTVSAYPLAGPTPGDATFASYAATRFGSAFYGMINKFDIVPASWEHYSLINIPYIFHNATFTSPDGSALVLAMPSALETQVRNLSFLTVRINYKRIAPDKEIIFSGVPLSIASQSLDISPYHAPVPAPTAFMQEAAWQHIPSYLYTGLQLPTNVIDTITAFITPPIFEAKP